MELSRELKVEVAPSGFQKTAVGEFPMDWFLKPLASRSEVKGRVGWKGYTKADLRSDGPITIGAKHIDKHFKLDLSDPTYLSRDKFNESPEIHVQKDDVLIVQRGTIGSVVLIDREVGDATINPSMLILRAKSIHPAYLYYQLTSTAGQKQILLDTSSTGVPMITQKQVGAFLIPLPPTVTEQRAIATALSDADALLGSLEQLIAKKKAIKQGALQALLTPPGQPGHKRLPGFKGEWGVKRFDSLAKPKKERATPSIDGVKHFCVELEHIESATGRLIGSTTTTLSSSQKTRFQKGDVLFGKLRAYLRKYWRATKPGVCSTEIWVLEPNRENVTSEFLVQLVTIRSFIEVASLGFGTHMPRSDWNLVRELELTIPSPDEQEAIATVLADMDNELVALETKLEKLRKVKQGMMQELLTGRKRLV